MSHSDKPHAVPLTVQCHNVHKSLLGDHGHLLGYPRRLPCHPREGGTLFIPIFGTLLHSRRHPLPPRYAFSRYAAMKTATSLCLLILLSIPMAVFASENIRITFNKNPSLDNFEQCSRQIKTSIDGHYANLQSPTYLTLMKPEAFAPLLKLIEEGNAYALRLGFELLIRALIFRHSRAHRNIPDV